MDLSESVAGCAHTRMLNDLEVRRNHPAWLLRRHKYFRPGQIPSFKAIWGYTLCHLSQICEVVPAQFSRRPHRFVLLCRGVSGGL